MFVQLFDYVFDGRIVVRDDQYRLPLSDDVGHDVEDRLRLACSRGALDNADLMLEGGLDSLLLAGIAAERVEKRWGGGVLEREFSGIQVTSYRRIVRNKLDFLILSQKQSCAVVGFQRIDGCHIPQIFEDILDG